MAFTQKTFALVGAHSAPTLAIYAYNTPDTLEEVTASGYFADKSNQLEKGDIIIGLVNGSSVIFSIDDNNKAVIILSDSAKNVRTVTGDTTALLSDRMIVVDASSGPVTVSLPAAATVSGKEFDIKKIDATASAMILDPDGTETIDGSTTISTIIQYTSITIKSDGVTWWIK
jgi:hypothetical protein